MVPYHRGTKLDRSVKSGIARLKKTTSRPFVLTPQGQQALVIMTYGFRATPVVQMKQIIVQQILCYFQRKATSSIDTIIINRSSTYSPHFCTVFLSPAPVAFPFLSVGGGFPVCVSFTASAMRFTLLHPAFPFCGIRDPCHCFFPDSLVSPLPCGPSLTFLFLLSFRSPLALLPRPIMNIESGVVVDRRK
jgi:hypothetical protein